MTQNSLNNTASIFDVDNLSLDNNNITSTNVNGNIFIEPNGTGDIITGKSTGENTIVMLRSVEGPWFDMDDQTDEFGIHNSHGSPEGAVLANIGSLDIDTTNGVLYIKKTDAANTGWTTIGGSSGSQVQFSSTSSASGFSTSAVIPLDNTIPQIGEGASVLTLAYTPLNASNTLLIEVSGYVQNSTPAGFIAVALFEQGTNDAIGASLTMTSASGASAAESFSLRAFVSASSINARTYEFRFGTTNGATTAYCNRTATTAAVFGSAGIVLLTIKEID